MIIYRVLNNNAVISKDENNNEIIVTGKGIAFNKGMYDEIKTDSILKIYVPKDSKEKNNLEMLISEIPYEFFEIAEYIREEAIKELELNLDEGLPLRLADHLNYSVEKYKRKIITPNIMLTDIKHFFAKELKFAKKMIVKINSRFDTNFDENEAGFIAFHIVSSEDEIGLNNVNEIMERLQILLDLIETGFDIKFDTESHEYIRLLTHLKFFVKKMYSLNNQNEQSLSEDSLYLMLIEKYSDINTFLDRMSAVTLVNYNYELSDSDRMYLIIHLARLIK